MALAELCLDHPQSDPEMGMTEKGNKAAGALGLQIGLGRIRAGRRSRLPHSKVLGARADVVKSLHGVGS